MAKCAACNAVFDFTDQLSPRQAQEPEIEQLIETSLGIEDMPVAGELWKGA